MRSDCNTEQLIVVVDEAGGLFRLFPDGSAAEVENEDDLRDIDTILALRPQHGSVNRIQGVEGERIAWVRCTECDGSGTYRGPVVCKLDYDDDRGYVDRPLRPYRDGRSLAYREFVVEESSCGCDRCLETGLVHQYTGQKMPIAVAELARVAS